MFWTSSCPSTGKTNWDGNVRPSNSVTLRNRSSRCDSDKRFAECDKPSLWKARGWKRRRRIKQVTNWFSFNMIKLGKIFLNIFSHNFLFEHIFYSMLFHPRGINASYTSPTQRWMFHHLIINSGLCFTVNPRLYPSWKEFKIYVTVFKVVSVVGWEEFIRQWLLS